MEALNNESLGLCTWMESGTTVDTALPKLRDMVNDKEEWRAVVIRVEDESEMKKYPTEVLNPFDFKINANPGEHRPLESPVPLVRLSQMLAGVPRQPVKFGCKKPSNSEDGMTVCVQLQNDYDPYEYDKLCLKYSYDGVVPSEVWLISVRADCRKEKEKAFSAWSSGESHRREEFWSRNRYPSACRFMAFDLTNSGPVQREADMLNFWTTVLILATNNIPASSLQAYELYRIKTEFDKVKMTAVFQDRVHKLQVAERNIEKTIEEKTRKAIIDAENVKIPDYAVSVEVRMQEPTANKLIVSESLFSNRTDNVAADVSKWSPNKPTADKHFEKLITVMDRAVDQTACGMNGKCEYPEEFVKPLNKYQKEDLYKSLDRTRSEIINLRSKLPRKNTKCEKELEKADKRVKEDLSVRITNEQISKGFGLLALIIFTCNLPALVFYAKSDPNNLWMAIIFAAAEVLLLALAIPVVLAAQYSKLKASIKHYNACIAARVQEMRSGMKQYSAFLSKVASHIKGSSYMNAAENKRFNVDSSFVKYREHQRELRRMVYQLQKWGNALHLKVNYKTFISGEESYAIDVNTPPASNAEYTIEHGKEYDIRLFPTKEPLKSSVSYVKGVKIAQEEKYYDYERTI